MRYAKVRRDDTWLSEPKGLARERLSDGAAAFACCEERLAENERMEAYWDSSDCSMDL